MALLLNLEVLGMYLYHKDISHARAKHGHRLTYSK